MKKKESVRKKKELLNFERAMLLLLIIAIFIIIKTAFTTQTSNLEQEANIVLAKLTDGEASLLSSNELVEEKVMMLDSMDYNELKSMLGVKNDFCVYFEDAAGNIVQIDGIRTGIGSDKISVNGEPCH